MWRERKTEDKRKMSFIGQSNLCVGESEIPGVPIALGLRPESPDPSHFSTLDRDHTPIPVSPGQLISRSGPPVS